MNNEKMNAILRRQPPPDPADPDDEDEPDMNDILDRRTDMAARRRAQHRRLFGDPDPHHNPAA